MAARTRSWRRVVKAKASSASNIPILQFGRALNIVSFTNDADDQVKLPQTQAGDIGKEIHVYASTGFEVISAEASGKLNNVTVGATNEGALVAGTFAIFKCVADNTWLTASLTTIDGTQSQLVPDAL